MDSLKQMMLNIFSNAALSGGSVGSVGRIGLSGMGAMGALGPSMTGLNPFMQMGIELTKIPGQLHDMGVALVEAQRSLGQYNGTIATAMAQLDVHRIYRDIQTGGENAESIKFVTQQTDALEKALRPMEAAYDRISNYLVGSLESVFADLISKLDGWFGLKVDDPADKLNSSPLFHAYAENVGQLHLQLGERKNNPAIKDIWGPVKE